MVAKSCIDSENPERNLDVLLEASNKSHEFSLKKSNTSYLKEN